MHLFAIYMMKVVVMMMFVVVAALIVRCLVLNQSLRLLRCRENSRRVSFFISACLLLFILYRYTATHRSIFNLIRRM